MRGFEGRRTSRLAGSPRSSSRAETLPESIWIQRSLSSSSLIKCRSSVEILRIPTENRISSPSDVLESWLVRIILRHYVGVGYFPIIVSHSFASLMLFLHLHTT
jgi:hypothetical protein